MSDSSVRYKRGLLTNTRGYQYREARLQHFNFSPSRQWYLVFYAWDIGQDRLVRKRVCKAELNKIIDLNERKEEAKVLIRSINQDLETGGYLQTHKKKIEEPVKAYDFHGYKLLNALDYIHNYTRDIEKKSKNTLRQYRYTHNLIRRFMEEEKIKLNFLLSQLNNTFIQRFSEFLQTKNDLANKTYNGAITTLHAGIEKLRKLDHALFPDRNPVKFQKLTVTSHTHAAYSDQQLNKIIERISQVDGQLLLFLRFIYFTLARPKEIRLLKVGHIRLEHKRILMAGENAKESKEVYVGISPAFEKMILESGVLNYPPDFFVFSSTGKPSRKPAGSSYFYKHYKKHLEALGFKKLNDRYTLYSFKHSGAISLYRSSKDLETVSKQCRHASLSQTDTYLQELGLFTDFSGLDKWQGF